MLNAFSPFNIFNTLEQLYSRPFTISHAQPFQGILELASNRFSLVKRTTLRKAIVSWCNQNGHEEILDQIFASVVSET